MTGPGHSRRLHRVLHGIAGVMLFLLALLPGWLLEEPASWISLRQPLIATGIIVVLFGQLTYRPRLARVSAGLCVAVAMLVPALALGEFVFRALHVDFRRAELTQRDLPPFYRRPLVPSGDCFLRRSGPLVWEGRVINTMCDWLRLETDAYADGPRVAVRYDDDGVRNPPRLADWEIAVAGDSFTELGYLPEERLFTSLLAGRLGRRVKNLGVSHTGPLTQLHYLQTYGIAPSTRTVVIAFFEGNDLDDLCRESEAWRRFEETGTRLRAVEPQSSLLRALGDAVVFGGEELKPKTPAKSDAMLVLPGRRIPVSLTNLPLKQSDLTPEVEEELARFLGGYRDLAAQHHLEAWLVYFPCKLRVWHGLLEFPAGAAGTLTNWTPTDLPDHLRGLCVAHEVRFLDVTPALVRTTREEGSLLFNPIVDTHFTAAGCEVVAAAMAEALAGAGTITQRTP
ncbi:MAG: hypothetical protein KDM81_07230 [Verrucomicrobiae bacterium]|nr:hypothetical protein [Verrucomicrobiae bacterium]